MLTLSRGFARSVLKPVRESGIGNARGVYTKTHYGGGRCRG